MEINDEQMLFLAMCLVPIKEDITIQQIRERFMKRDRQWNEADARAEYRLGEAQAILTRWKSATHR